jgi:hypothetical protein
MYNLRRLLVSSMALALIGGSALAGDKDKHDGDRDGSWEKLGKVTASHNSDHDKIKVEARHDDFRKLKFRVSDSPLNMHRIIVTYDNGGAERLEVRQNIPKGGETRDIDLQGGKRSIRTIEFWYDTKGLLNGKADVTAYGRR